MSTTSSRSQSQLPAGSVGQSQGANLSASQGQVTAPRLAIYGGPRSVTLKYRERWRAVRFPELATIFALGMYGKSTHAGGGGLIAKFEAAFTDLTGTRYGLVMNSGTSTLHSAYMACGVGPGDEVIVPSYTFFASVAPILQTGATPIFCDVDPHTLTADPDDVERRITPRTKAICVVHVWGNPARMDRFVQLARKHDIALIEDCSHAHGASYAGKSVGAWGDIGCFSLQGLKPVSGGELGIAVTNNPVYYDRMLAVGHYGRSSADQKSHTLNMQDLSLGVKYRPHLFGVVLARFSLKRLPQLNALRRRNYQILCDELRDNPVVRPVATYDEATRGGLLEFLLKFHPEATLGWNRGAFVHACKAEGVPIDVDRYRPLHNHPVFSRPIPPGFGGVFREGVQRLPVSPIEPTDLSVTNAICPNLMTMPPFTKVSEAFVRQCAAALKKVALATQTLRNLRDGE